MSNILIPGIGFQYDPLGTLTNGLVSYYNMQGNSNDIWGTNNGVDTAIAYGTAYGKVGEGVEFTASNSGISIGNTITPPTSISLAAWVYFTGNPKGGYNGIIDKLDTGANYFSYILQTNGTAGQGGFQVGYTTNGTTNSYFNSNSTVSQNAWHFIVATITTGGTGNIYIDNVLDVSTTTVSGNLNYTSSNNTEIGIRPDNQIQFPGYIDEVGIWNRALSPAEISELYNSGAGQTLIGNIFDTETITESSSISQTMIINSSQLSGGFWAQGVKIIGP